MADQTKVRIHMVNTGEIAVATTLTPNGRVCYDGDAVIDGVPGAGAPIVLMFDNLNGSMCGALLPTGNPCDVVRGVDCTLIDNGMPVVVMRAADFGLTGEESRDELEAMDAVKTQIEAIRKSGLFARLHLFLLDRLSEHIFIHLEEFTDEIIVRAQGVLQQACQIALQLRHSLRNQSGVKAAPEYLFWQLIMHCIP